MKGDRVLSLATSRDYESHRSCPSLTVSRSRQFWWTSHSQPADHHFWFIFIWNSIDLTVKNCNCVHFIQLVKQLVNCMYIFFCIESMKLPVKLSLNSSFMILFPKLAWPPDPHPTRQTRPDTGATSLLNYLRLFADRQNSEILATKFYLFEIKWFDCDQDNLEF